MDCEITVISQHFILSYYSFLFLLNHMIVALTFTFSLLWLCAWFRVGFYVFWNNWTFSKTAVCLILDRSPPFSALFQTLSFALADKIKAKIILANDPDADRLAVAEKQDRYKLIMITYTIENIKGDLLGSRMLLGSLDLFGNISRLLCKWSPYWISVKFPNTEQGAAPGPHDCRASIMPIKPTPYE